MLKIEKVVLPSAEQWEAIIRGMRNPKNSWDLSDSYRHWASGPTIEEKYGRKEIGGFEIGEADHKLMSSLANGGPVHAKYRRMIPVYLDITAPLYWWKEFDTYKIGTVANSCSTMHKIQAKEFTLEDFSVEHLLDYRGVGAGVLVEPNDVPLHVFKALIECLNTYRIAFLETKDKKYWWQMIQLLPSSYNQKRTVMLNYEVLHNIYHSRKNHKLDEWHVVCAWIESLPYSELITGKEKEPVNLERLKHICTEMRDNGLPEWKEFTSWVEQVLAEELITGKEKSE